MLLNYEYSAELCQWYLDCYSGVMAPDIVYSNQIFCNYLMNNFGKFNSFSDATPTQWNEQ